MTKVQITMDDVLNFMRVRGDLSAIAREVLVRRATALAAKSKGIEVTDDEIQKAADAFRMVNGLQSAASTTEWFANAGITLDHFEEYLETNILIKKFKESFRDEDDFNRVLHSDRVKSAVCDILYDEWLKKELAE